MILSLLLLSLTALLVSSQEVEYQRGQLVPSHLFNKITESPGPGYIKKRAWNSGFHTGMGKRHGNRMTDVKRYIDWLTGYPGGATFLKAPSRTTNEKQAIPMLGTRKTPELARKKAKMDQIRRWGKRARGSLRDKKERLLLFRGQMNSNKNLRGMWGKRSGENQYLQMNQMKSNKNLRGMWGKRSGENQYLKQPVAEFWPNWRNFPKVADMKRGRDGESWLGLRGSGNSGMWGKRSEGLEDHHEAAENFYYEE